MHGRMKGRQRWGSGGRGRRTEKEGEKRKRGEETGKVITIGRQKEKQKGGT